MQVTSEVARIRNHMTVKYGFIFGQCHQDYK